MILFKRWVIAEVFIVFLHQVAIFWMIFPIVIFVVFAETQYSLYSVKDDINIIT